MIYTVANAKGGVGKSALAYLLAHYIAEKKGKDNVFCVDSDTTQLSFKLSCIPEQNIEGTPILQFIKFDDFQKMKTQDNKFFVIDTSPSLNETTKQAIKMANLVIVPTLLTPPIVKQTFDFCQLLKNKNLAYVIVPNLASKHESQLQTKALELLESNKTDFHTYDDVLYSSENLKKNIANSERDYTKGLLLEQRQTILKLLTFLTE